MSKVRLPYALIKFCLQNKKETYLSVYCRIKMSDTPAGYGSQFKYAPVAELIKSTGFSRQTIIKAIDYWAEMGFIRKIRGEKHLYALVSNRDVHTRILEDNPSWTDCVSPGGRKIKLVKYDLSHFDSFEAKDLFFGTFICEEAFRQRNGRLHRLRTGRKTNPSQKLSFQLALRTIAERLNLHFVTASRKLHRLADIGMLQIKHDIKLLPYMPGVRCEHLNGLHQSKHKQRVFVPSKDGFVGWGPNLYSIESFYQRGWARVV